jgi:methionyl-tRNA formyltransferase
MLIQILVDNPNSWIIPYAKELAEKITTELGYEANFTTKHENISKGNVLCLLSCEKIFSNLELNQYNLVVHESDLPQGKGWSPLTWQILEGKNAIPITLFEAQEKVDSGVIYNKTTIDLEGHELIEEIKHLQGLATQKLILDFLKNIDQMKGIEQEGKESFYPKRTEKDSELDPSKSIDEQFDLLRVCDNERYPAFFMKNGKKYLVKIYKEED